VEEGWLRWIWVRHAGYPILFLRIFLSFNVVSVFFFLSSVLWGWGFGTGSVFPQKVDRRNWRLLLLSLCCCAFRCVIVARFCFLKRFETGVDLCG